MPGRSENTALDGVDDTGGSDAYRNDIALVAIEAEGIAVVSIALVKGMSLRAPRVETEHEWVFVGLGDPVQESITRGYEDMFHFLVDDHGWEKGDACAVMSAVGHSRLSGPTGSTAPDPLHPFSAVGAVTDAVDAPLGR